MPVGVSIDFHYIAITLTMNIEKAEGVSGIGRKHTGLKSEESLDSFEKCQ